MITILAVLLILFFTLKLLGIQVYAVYSGSMRPEYEVGSLIFVEKVESDQIIEGDDITFTIDGSVATHRVMQVNREESNVATYGINNKNDQGEYIIDSTPVVFSNIIGKVIFSVPILGYTYLFLSSLYGKITIIVLLLLILSVEYITRYREEKRNEKDV